MKNSAPGGLLSRQDRIILESAEVLLRPDRPDQFDYSTLASMSGVARHLVLEAFPYPELLAVGVVVSAREEKERKLEIRRQYEQSCLAWPNGFQLAATGWEPDSGLLAFFAAHPVVRSYRETVCTPESTMGVTGNE